MQYPQAETIHLVMDNLNIHHRKSLMDVFGVEIVSEIWDRFTVHFTPHPRKLAESGGNRNRHLLAAMPREQKNLGSEGATPREPWLELPHEPRPHQDQLEVRPPSRSSQIRL
jgi:hypothetical protein